MLYRCFLGHYLVINGNGSILQWHDLQLSSLNCKNAVLRLNAVAFDLDEVQSELYEAASHAHGDVLPTA